ncbi:MAG: Kelch repeat-containing protein [Bacteroidales bacterium]
MKTLLQMILLPLALIFLTMPGNATAQAPETREAILVIGGAGEGMDFTNIAMAWVPEEDRWYRLTEMPTKRRAMAYSEYEGQLYVIGGWTGEPEEERDQTGLVALDVVEVYDPMTNTWKKRAPMPRKRGKMAHMYPSVNGKIPVAGGERNNARLSEAAVYHIEEDRWEIIEDLHETWTFPYVMQNPNEPHLVHFAAGNTDMQHNQSDFHSVLNMNTFEWDHQSKARYPIEITDGDGSIFYNGLWWTLGGWSYELGSVIDVYAYDFDNDRWLEKPTPPFASWTHQGASVIEVDGEERIYMMGGRIDRQLTDAIWYYNGKEWQDSGTKMPVALWNFMCVTKEINLDNLEPIN